MNSAFTGFVLGFLALVTGCSAATDDTSIQTVPLAGNGELAQLDFLNPIYPLRGNAPPAVVDGKTSLAVARFIDVTSRPASTPEAPVLPAHAGGVHLRGTLGPRCCAG